jgi:hypothetical protein
LHSSAARQRRGRGIIGANIFWRQDRFFCAATLQYAIRTRFAYGHRYANEFQWTGAWGCT